MKDIFTELYKKVLGFFQMPESEEEESKTVAVNRMKLVLMQDRTNLTPFLLEKMRGELIDLLSRYVEMDKEALELNFEQEGEQMALMLSIPVVRAKDEEEIQAMIKEEEEAKAAAEAEEADESEETEEEESQETSEETEEESEDETSDSEEEETTEESEESEEDSGEDTEETDSEESSKKSKKKQ